ncbi:hypothetical protein PFICI_02185 [Pestalotiopsis fici W106-1]|uniref:Uncharacterized protein n=1 Tax=Pestalotiopsis fici (strain W106-1 / CGMCC3.15140) TaxID=1229662 RepID=W3XDN2_PESFW|nr:uncharacterized protein PFICI_02185 [Pestalotiopsis fici W106-1]ETS84160.1 hypothetical protein PFICI_02185 [Pestalotiopsis fici W106-1]
MRMEGVDFSSCHESTANNQKRQIAEDGANNAQTNKRLCMSPEFPQASAATSEVIPPNFPQSIPEFWSIDSNSMNYGMLDDHLTLQTNSWDSSVINWNQGNGIAQDAHETPSWYDGYDIGAFFPPVPQLTSEENSGLTPSTFDFGSAESPSCLLQSTNYDGLDHLFGASQLAFSESWDAAAFGPFPGADIADSASLKTLDPTTMGPFEDHESKPSIQVWEGSPECASDQQPPDTIPDHSASNIATSTATSPSDRDIDSAQAAVAVVESNKETPTKLGSRIDDCDTCFGVIVITSISSLPDAEITKTSEVDIIPFGNILKFSFKDSGAYAGMLSQTVLRKLSSDFTICYRGILIQPGASPKKTASKKNGSYSSDCELRLVVFGLAADKIAVGRALSDSDLFLQPPYESECPSHLDYHNPHYLLRPGSEMPRLEKLTFETSGTEKQSNLTELAMGRLQQIFDSSDIDKSTLGINVEPSNRLRTPLLRHQQTAMAMMIDREQGGANETRFPSLWIPVTDEACLGKYRHIITGERRDNPCPIRGGVLADDMGLGKTLTTLGLICSSLDAIVQDTPASEAARYTSTLIITPKSTLPGWEKQIADHIHTGCLKSTRYYGSSRKQLRSIPVHHDVVITTYETLRSDYENQGPLFTHKWLRVILDEAHHIRNRTTKNFQAVCALKSFYRWCITGTPIHNSLDDYGALLTFLGVDPFQEKSSFGFWIVSPFTQQGPRHVEKIKSLVNATCIRRTKLSSSVSLTLPEVIEKIEYTPLSGTDQLLYEFFKKMTAEIAAKVHHGSKTSLESKGSKGTNILALMSSLRLICNHGKDLLPDTALKMWSSREDRQLDASLVLRNQDYCEECGDMLECALNTNTESTNPKIRTTRLACPTCRQSEEDDVIESQDSDRSIKSQGISLRNASSLQIEKGGTRPSVKVAALIRNIREEQSSAISGKPHKSVVFSCWSKMLDLLEAAFVTEGISFRRIDGQTSLDARGEALKQFNESLKCTVMLATTGSCGEGINLAAATNVHLMEPNWNPMMEAQAVDRVHRIGQTQIVTIIRYIVPRSIEMYIREIQMEKLHLISHAINNSASGDFTDLKIERWKKFQACLQDAPKT